MREMKAVEWWVVCGFARTGQMTNYLSGPFSSKEEAEKASSEYEYLEEQNKACGVWVREVRHEVWNRQV